VPDSIGGVGWQADFRVLCAKAELKNQQKEEDVGWCGSHEWWFYVFCEDRHF